MSQDNSLSVGDVKIFAQRAIDVNSLLMALTNKDFELFDVLLQPFFDKYFADRIESYKFMTWLLTCHLTIYSQVCSDNVYDSLLESSHVYLNMIDNPEFFNEIENGSKES